MRKIIAIGGAAALVMAGAAVAQQSDQRMGRWGDADGDGRVAQAEFVESRISRLQAMDADNNGVVTEAERTAARQARMAERRETRFAQLDANGDGMIARAEFDAAHEQMRGQRGERGARHGGMRGGRGGHHRDASGDVVIADAQARMVEHFTAMDANRDGFVTSDERRAMMAERRGRRMAPPSPATE